MLYSELEKILLAYPNKDWDFRWLSMNPNISLTFIESNPQFSWNYYFISSHPKLTVEFIKKNINIHSKINKWNMKKLASNKYLSIEYILNEIDPKYWSMSKLSCNRTLTMDIINKNLHIDWHWHNLTLNPSISVNDISSNSSLPWEVRHIMYTIPWPYCIENKLNKHLSEHIGNINKNSIDVPYNIEMLYFENDLFNIYNINWRGNITLNIIKENSNFPWNFRVISGNNFDYQYKSYNVNIIKSWYKKIKLSRKLWLVIEIMIIEQMKPDGKYMQKLMQSWNTLE